MSVSTVFAGFNGEREHVEGGSRDGVVDSLPSREAGPESIHLNPASSEGGGESENNRNGAETLKDLLISLKYIDPSGNLCKIAHSITAPAIDVREKLNLLLDEPHTIKGTSLTFTLREVFSYLTQYTIYACVGIDLIGGYVLHLLGADYFKKCLNCLGIDHPDRYIDPRFLRKLQRIPFDIDIRYYLPGYSHAQLEHMSHLFRCFLALRLNPNYLDPSFNHTYKFICNYAFEKWCHPCNFEQRLHYLIHALNDVQNTELMFVDQLPRYHLFTCNSLFLPLESAFSESHEELYLETNLETVWKAIFHQMAMIIDADNLDSVDHMGFPMYISYLIKGYVCLKPLVEETLFRKFASIFLSGDPIAIDSLLKVLSNHHRDDPYAPLFYAYQLLFTSSKYFSPRQVEFALLRKVVGIFASVTGTDEYATHLSELIGDNAIPFELISALLTVYGHIAEGCEESKGLVMRRGHCEGIVMQISFPAMSHSHQLTCSSDLLHALKILNEGLPTLEGEALSKVGGFESSFPTLQPISGDILIKPDEIGKVFHLLLSLLSMKNLCFRTFPLSLLRMILRSGSSEAIRREFLMNLTDILSSINEKSFQQEIVRLGAELFEPAIDGDDLVKALEEQYEFIRRWTVCLLKSQRRELAKKAVGLARTLPQESDRTQFFQHLIRSHFDMACKIAGESIEDDETSYACCIAMTIQLADYLLMRPSPIRVEVYLEDVVLQGCDLAEGALQAGFVERNILLDLLTLGKKLAEVSERLESRALLEKLLKTFLALLNRYRHLIDDHPFPSLWLGYFKKSLSFSCASDFWRCAEAAQVPFLLREDPVFLQTLLHYIDSSEKGRKTGNFWYFFEQIDSSKLLPQAASLFKKLRGEYLSQMINRGQIDKYKAYVIDNRIEAGETPHPELCEVFQFCEETKRLQTIPKKAVDRLFRILKTASKESALYLGEYCEEFINERLSSSGNERGESLAQVVRLLNSRLVRKLYPSPDDFFLRHYTKIIQWILADPSKESCLYIVPFVQEYTERFLLLEMKRRQAGDSSAALELTLELLHHMASEKISFDTKFLLSLPEDICCDQPFQRLFLTIYDHTIAKDRDEETLSASLQLFTHLLDEEQKGRWIPLVTAIADRSSRSLKLEAWKIFISVIEEKRLFDGNHQERARSYFQAVRCIAEANPSLCCSLIMSDDSFISLIFKERLLQEELLEFFSFLLDALKKYSETSANKGKEELFSKMIAFRIHIDEIKELSSVDVLDAQLIEIIASSKNSTVHENLWICFSNIIGKSEWTLEEKRVYHLYNQLAQGLPNKQCDSCRLIYTLFHNSSIKLLRKNPLLFKLELMFEVLSKVDHKEVYPLLEKNLSCLAVVPVIPLDHQGKAIHTLSLLLKNTIAPDGGVAIILLLDQEKIRSMFSQEQYEDILEVLFHRLIDSCYSHLDRDVSYCRDVLVKFLLKKHLIINRVKRDSCARKFYEITLKLLEQTETRNLSVELLRCYFLNSLKKDFQTDVCLDLPVYWTTSLPSFDQPETILPYKLPSVIGLEKNIHSKTFDYNYSRDIIVLAKTALNTATADIKIQKFIIDLSYEVLIRLITHYQGECFSPEGQEVIQLFFSTALPMNSFELLNDYKKYCQELIVDGYKYGIFDDLAIVHAVSIYINPAEKAKYTAQSTYYSDLMKIMDNLMNINTEVSLYQTLDILKHNAKGLFQNKPKERSAFFRRLCIALEKKPFVDEAGTPSFDLCIKCFLHNGSPLGKGGNRKDKESNLQIATQLIASGLNACTNLIESGDLASGRRFLTSLVNIFVRLHHNDLSIGWVTFDSVLTVWIELQKAYVLKAGDVKLAFTHMKLMAVTFQSGNSPHQSSYQQTVTAAIKKLLSYIATCRMDGAGSCLNEAFTFFSQETMMIDTYEKEKIRDLIIRLLV